MSSRANLFYAEGRQTLRTQWTVTPGETRLVVSESLVTFTVHGKDS
jgi:hypothetical protein